MKLLYAASKLIAHKVIPAEAGIQESTGCRIRSGMTSCLLYLSSCIIGWVFLDIFHTSLLWGEEARQAVEVFPSTPVYQYAIYGNLVIFWIGILGLLVIIRMKLKEIERVQRMGLDQEK